MSVWKASEVTFLQAPSNKSTDTNRRILKIPIFDSHCKNARYQSRFWSRSGSDLAVCTAVFLQALTPLASLLPSGLMCGANLVGTSFGPISVFVTIGMTSITLVNPIATIAIIKPYRHALLAVVFGRKSKNAVSAASSHFEGLDPATTIAVNAGTRGPSAAVC